MYCLLHNVLLHLAKSNFFFNSLFLGRFEKILSLLLAYSWNFILILIILIISDEKGIETEGAKIIAAALYQNNSLTFLNLGKYLLFDLYIFLK